MILKADNLKALENDCTLKILGGDEKSIKLADVLLDAIKNIICYVRVISEYEFLLSVFCLKHEAIEINYQTKKIIISFEKP